MNKVWLIIQREFLIRVTKKSFLITTILVPLIIPVVIGGLIYVMVKESESAKPDTVMVVDESHQFTLDSTKNTKRFHFVSLDMKLEQAKKAYNETKDFALLYVPPFDISNPEGLVIYTQENPSIEKVGDLESILEERVRDLKLQEFKIDKEVLKNLKTKINLKQINLSKTGEEKTSNAGILYGMGFALGILIYIFVLVYGIQIMQGVIDEKTSRVVEIIVSSVKPFQLMLGKIVGIAAVGVVQFLIWIILITFLSTGVLGYFGLKMPQKQMMEEVSKKIKDDEIKQAVQQQQTQSNDKINEVLQNVNEIPFAKIAFVFVFYFLGGYLLYGALFAAVGSAVESIQESQQFQFPITLPLLIGYFGLFMFILRDPHGPVSFWLSVIPFTSPVAMVGRIAFDVPTWQLILSMLMLIGGFIFTTWVAGRIYRVGILMTGTKVNWKVMAKWFMMRE
ncbi:MAG: ABC transporter, permease protein [Cytophagales bacterium]|jgi:ABC-2 type transport system permease protein|nr:ABC transporter permease [Bacteroidota bacterium]MBS1980826.1 ABC transporter permease [Bacteroidota bacterium]WHZ08172.1 MAG: ABC transporter, permease protein [Cytophagales bacterium]